MGSGSVANRAATAALHLGHDFGYEVTGFLFDPRSHLEAFEAGDTRARVLQQLLDAQIRILHERLAVERDLAQGLAQSPLDHLRHDLGRLALAARLLGENLALLGNDLGRNVRERDVARTARCDVHGKIMGERGIATLERHEGPDARAVNIRTEMTRRGEDRKATHPDVLTDFRDERAAALVNALAAREPRLE